LIITSSAQQQGAQIKLIKKDSRHTLGQKANMQPYHAIKYKCTIKKHTTLPNKTLNFDT
jgi:hypothetical protein